MSPGGPSGIDAARQLFGARFEELAGGHVAGEIPVSERVINRLIADRLGASAGPVEAAEVRLQANGDILARVRLRRPRFAPPVTVAARVEGQPELPALPVVVLGWRLPGMGALAALAAPALAFFDAAPPGIRVQPEHIIVDLRRLLESHGAGELLEYLRSLRLTVREGAVLVSFELRAER